MLQIILHIIIISVVCMIWGLPVLLLQKKHNSVEDFIMQSFLDTLLFLFFSGLILLSIIVAWLCIITPLNFSLLMLLTAALVFYLLMFKRKKIKIFFKTKNEGPSFSLIELVFIVVCLVVFIVLGTLQPVNSDTHIYHVQIVLWFNEYGTVPGIANLYPRFGLGSSWFSLISIFRIPLFKQENFTYLNVTTVIWFFLWLFNKRKWHINHWQNAASKIMSLYYLLIILFCLSEWELFRDASNSTNYDFIVSALNIMLISYLLESIILNKYSQAFSLWFVILGIAIIPFKLSGSLVLLLLIYYLFNYKSFKYWLWASVAGIVILTPLLLKNYIITGYPLYPLSWSFFSPDWQVPKEMTDYLKNYIHVANRFYNDYGLDIKKIPELINKPWINKWFNGILVQQKIIICTAASSLLIFFLKTDLQINYKKLRIVFMVLMIMAGGWFFSAPSPRFSYGVLLPLAFFPICFYGGSKLPSLLQKVLILIVTFTLCFYLYKKISSFNSNWNLILYPYEIEKPPVKTINIKGTNFYFPETVNNNWMRKCYGTRLPCVCEENKYLEPRGARLQDGFRMNPKPDSIFINHYNY